MILEYKFEYLSNNNTLTNYLLDIASEQNIEVHIVKNQNIIDCYVEADEDKLLNFSDKISSNLPMSMFLTNSDVSIVDDIPKSNYPTTIDKKYNLPFCPKCLQQVEDENSNNYYNPFTSCKMCIDTSKINELILSQNDQINYSTEFKEVFQNIAKNINEGLKVKIKTLSGTFVFEKIDNLKEQDNQKDINLLCTNLANISNVLVAKKMEVVTLASIEKPQLELRVNEVYKCKNIIKTENINVRYPNDFITYLISKELINYNISFLSYKKDDNYDMSLEFENFKEEQTIDIPKVKILSNDRLVVLKSNNYDNTLLEVYNQFEELSKGQFVVLLNENDLFKKKILHFHTSTTQNDGITLYSSEIDGFLDVLNFQLPNSMEELFEDIAKDETGAKLLNNYKNKFSQTYENALSFDINTLDKNSIFSLWKIAEIILGFDNSIIKLATKCLLEKGPRIDYKLLEKKEFYNKTFNILKLFKSAMSFKLAGVDDNTISLGYIESYTHFISNIIDEIHSEIQLDGVSLSGDIFTNNLISTLTHKSITKNFSIFYNKDFPLENVKKSVST